MAEIPFEVLYAALEAARGTAITPPTHALTLTGMVTPVNEYYRPDSSSGTLAEYTRAQIVRQWGEWEAEGALDPATSPLLFNMALKAVTTPTTPSGGTTTRLWTFVPTITADDIKSATITFGDPNVQLWRAPFCMVDDLEIDADASGTDGATIKLSGTSQFPIKVANPTPPAQIIGPLLMPGSMQVFLDTASPIGTTELVGRAVSANFKLSTGVTYKYLANGTTGNLSYTRIGRAKRHAESTVVFELLDTAQYDVFAAGTPAKLRVRINGPLIEGMLYHYVEWDIYGPLDAMKWGELEKSNRTIELMVKSQTDTTLGADFAVRVQNNRTML